MLSRPSSPPSPPSQKYAHKVERVSGRWNRQWRSRRRDGSGGCNAARNNERLQAAIRRVARILGQGLASQNLVLNTRLPDRSRVAVVGVPSSFNGADSCDSEILEAVEKQLRQPVLNLHSLSASAKRTWRYSCTGADH